MANNFASFEAQFMKKLSNNEAELKKCVAYKKSVWSVIVFSKTFNV